MIRTWLALTLTAILAGAGCTDGTLEFGGGGTLTQENDNIVVSGDIDDTQILDANGNIVAVPAGRDVAVFVYSDLRCCNTSFTPATDLPFRSMDFNTSPFDAVELADLTFSDVESVIVSGGSGSFEVSDVGGGDLTVILLLDDIVPDGSIEANDAIAILLDENSELTNIGLGRSVTANAIDITFDRNFPTGRAVPNSIEVVTTEGSAP